MTRRQLGLLSALAAAVVVFAPLDASAQCAMCRRALETPEGRHLAAAFRSGIIVLLAAPFSIVGAITVLARRMARRHDDTPAA